eukprot:NODE_2765_length_1096_cov_23.597523_g2639_i0.p1 GENE.NODE_2765_length_1096_cov_23.597523_g2639_i0~~NODE_2765_length_1096_cov_23.597523_g2639_i0.p1  ORF type:complete len:351 (+),score=69.64 NODE_2765_length_1096_cov_23.597523_g2639_i0:11-1063(+)
MLPLRFPLRWGLRTIRSHPDYSIAKDSPTRPQTSPLPHLFENNTLYDGRLLDQTAAYDPVVLRSTLLDSRYTEYLKTASAPTPLVPFGEYNPDYSIRSAVVGVKVRSLRFFDSHGNAIPITAIWVPNCFVLKHLLPDSKGLYGMYLGMGFHPPTEPPWDGMPIFAAAGIAPGDVLHETRLTEDAMLPIGFQLTVRHFMPGQWIEINSRSKDRGFQGVMKRWGFKGGPASHGSSFHRTTGAIGSRSGEVHKGKKMPGFMGGRHSVQSHRIHLIDFKNDLLYVEGSIHGPVGRYAMLTDSRQPGKVPVDPPFPSHLPSPAETLDALSFDACQLKGPDRYHRPRDLEFEEVKK